MSTTFWDIYNRTVPPDYGTDGTYVGPPPAGGGGGGGDPGSPGGGAAPGSGTQSTDWNALIRNDDLYKQLQGDLSAQGISDAAQRAAATKRAVISFGVAPDLNGLGLDRGFLGQDLDDATMTTARNNPFSIAKRIDRAFKENLTGLRTSLRQRGAMRSGEAGYGAQRVQTGYDEGKYDALQKLMDYINGVQQSFVGSERNRQWMLYQALLAAAGRQLATNTGTTSTTGGPTTPGGPTAPGGSSGSSGNIPGSEASQTWQEYPAVPNPTKSGVQDPNPPVQGNPNGVPVPNVPGGVVRIDADGTMYDENGNVVN